MLIYVPRLPRHIAAYEAFNVVAHLILGLHHRPRPWWTNDLGIVGPLPLNGRVPVRQQTIYVQADTVHNIESKAMFPDIIRTVFGDIAVSTHSPCCFVAVYELRERGEAFELGILGLAHLADSEVDGREGLQEGLVA